VAAGVDPNVRNSKQATPLHIAAKKGHAEACRALIKSGAAVGAQDKHQFTPLHRAAQGGHAEVCRVLMEVGAAVGAQAEQQITPLHMAAEREHTEVCRVLIESGAAVEARDAHQATPLHYAAQYGHAEVCRVLMKAGAVIEAQAARQNTPLHMAAQHGHAEVCCMLMKAGAAVEAQNSLQSTPLHLAAQSGHAEVCRMLMNAGAAVGAQAAKQYTPLHLAAQGGNLEVCRILMKARAVVDARGYSQCTPLQFAALNGHDSTSMLLAFEGADLTARISTNHTPTSLALSEGHAALAAHLRSTNGGAHYLRCTGPSLERRLLWNDTNQQQQETMLDEMQAQWLARVVEGCAHARVGLTLRGAFGGGLSTCMLLHVMGYVFGGTLAHLQSCISTGRVAAARELATQTAAAFPVVDGVTVAAEAAGAVPAAKSSEVGDTGRGGPMQDLQEPAQHEQEQLSPKLALVSHALALAATPAPHPGASRRKLQAALARLAAEAAEGDCEWLQAYCDFLQRRHRLGKWVISSGVGWSRRQ
jgi:ankyrin repeat protein